MREDRDFRLPEISRSDAIPKILHQNFLPGWGNIPPNLMALTQALTDRNPGWDLRFMDAAAAEAFIEVNYGSKFLQVYHSIDPAYYAAQSDLLRYLVLYAEGGVYFDVKSTGLRPLDEVLLPDDQFILSHWPKEPGFIGSSWSAGKRKELRHVLRGEYMQWFIAAARGHPYLKAVIELVLKRIANYNVLRDGVGHIGVLRVTGPIAYTLAIEPIRKEHPHRLVEAERDLSFIYKTEVPATSLEEQNVFGWPHYSKQSIPVIMGHPVRSGFISGTNKLARAAKRVLRRPSKFDPKTGSGL